jgi:uncharacterized protein YydD (DUF2326 family)
MREIQFLNYLDGKLPTNEVKDFERFLILNPENFDLLSSLARMKRDMKSSDAVIKFLEEKTNSFLQKLAQHTF